MPDGGWHGWNNTILHQQLQPIGLLPCQHLIPHPFQPHFQRQPGPLSQAQPTRCTMMAQLRWRRARKNKAPPRSQQRQRLINIPVPIVVRPPWPGIIPAPVATGA
jgi:hypothetical protein